MSEEGEVKCSFLTSKCIFYISILFIFLAICILAILLAFRRDLILNMRFEPANNIIVNVISSTNNEHYLRIPFYMKNDDIKKIFDLQEEKSIDLFVLRVDLSREICSRFDTAWKHMCILDHSDNLKLYYRYCKEFLNDSSQFPDSTLTIEEAELFVKKFEILEKTQAQCNTLGQTFIIGVAIVSLLALFVIFALVASCRICFCSADDGIKSNVLQNEKK
jgi:hypothetical protein